MPDDWLLLAYVCTYGYIYRGRVAYSFEHLEGKCTTMTSRNPDLRHHGTGNRKRKQCKNGSRYPEKKGDFFCHEQQLKTILKQLTTYLTHLHCSLFPVLTSCRRWCNFFLKKKAILHAISIRLVPLSRLGPHGNVRWIGRKPRHVIHQQL
jgi:hypothetical protein